MLAIGLFVAALFVIGLWAWVKFDSTIRKAQGSIASLQREIEEAQRELRSWRR